MKVVYFTFLFRLLEQTSTNGPLPAYVGVYNASTLQHTAGLWMWNFFNTTLFGTTSLEVFALLDCLYRNPETFV